MKLVEIKNGVVDLPDGKYFIEKHYKKRTSKMNRCLHLYFQLLADELNSAGYDMKKLVRFDIPWNQLTVKEYLWRPLQTAMFKKRSSTKLTTTEMSKVYDVLDREISNRTGVQVDWPNIDSL